MMDGEEEEPNCLFAHGFFRRSGDAGPVTVPGGIRLLDGGLEPIPTTGTKAWASCRCRLRGRTTGPCPPPHCDASRARPSTEAGLRTDIAELRRSVKNKVRTCPMLSLSPLRERVTLASARVGRGAVLVLTAPLPAHSARHPPPQRREGKETRRVMAGLVPAIHVFAPVRLARRGSPEPVRG
jgi:hypothetical protein